MHHVMYREIEGIPCYKTRKKGKRVISHEHLKNQKQDSGNGNADKGRHRQSFLIFWEFMMNSMDCILNFLPQPGIGTQVKYKPVHEVFK